MQISCKLFCICERIVMNRSNSYSTSKRTKILDYIIKNSHKDVSVKEISNYLDIEQNMTVNVTTIYRYLDKLEKDGKVIKHISDNGHTTLFQYVKPDNNCHDHLHMKCSKCGKIMHLDCEFMEEFKHHIYKEHKFTIEFTSSMIYGICDSCNVKN